jgi:galactokinase
MTRLEVHRAKRLSDVVGKLRARGPADDAEIFAVIAPLRICPLGAHVDHQGGVVTGLTVDRSVLLAAVPNRKPRFEVSSLDFSGTAVVDLQHPGPGPRGDWADFARAAVSALASRGALDVGLRAVVGGDLPGSGLSSSAAVLICYLMALARVNGFDLSREEVSALVQQAENQFMGVASGRLDQSIILFGEQGHLTVVNCSDLAVRQVPAPPGGSTVAILAAFSGLGRALVGSSFNQRVGECREAARALLERGGRKNAVEAVLSDVDRDLFNTYGSGLPEPLRRRALHYFSEQARVAAGVDAWRAGDLSAFGRLMTASGESSIENYECGTSETIALWNILRSTPGVLGARFSGAGFGGSCIALVEHDRAMSIADEVHRRYAAECPGQSPAATFDICLPSGPARLLTTVT